MVSVPLSALSDEALATELKTRGFAVMKNDLVDINTVSQITGFSVSTLRKKNRLGTMPAGSRFGHKTLMWFADEIIRWKTEERNKFKEICSKNKI